jgi:hypothetical protein
MLMKAGRRATTALQRIVARVAKRKDEQRMK